MAIECLDESDFDYHDAYHSTRYQRNALRTILFALASETKRFLDSPDGDASRLRALSETAYLCEALGSAFRRRAAHDDDAFEFVMDSLVDMTPESLRERCDAVARHVRAARVETLPRPD